MSLPEEQPSYEEPLSPVGTMQSGLAALFVTPNLKINYRNGIDLSMTNLSSTRVSHQATAVKGVLNNGEHTLIPVTAKMIHSAIWDSKRFDLKDG